jgi:hypothetical protein
VDLMGLNQWEFTAKTGQNAHDAVLGGGLPGAAKPVKPPPPLSASAKGLTAAFDKQFPADKDTGAINVPNSDAYSGKIASGTDAHKMAHDTDYDGNGADAYKVTIGGKPYLLQIGQADAEYDLGLFDMNTGKAIAYNWNGDGWTSQ